MQQVQVGSLPSHLRLMDTSFFRMSLKLLSRHYAKRMDRGTAGIKLGLILDPEQGAPVQWITRVGQGADTLCLDDLFPKDADIAGLTFLFDRGFTKYAFFQDLITRGAHFVTRALARTHYRVLEERPLDPAKPTIVADQVVILGRRESRNLMTSPVRRVMLKTEKDTLVFLTSDFELTAWEVTELYRRRWEIEIFFRWLKRNLNCLQPLGHSIEAAEHTFYAALAAHLLVLLLLPKANNEQAGTPHQKAKKRGQPLKSTLQHIRAGLYQPPTQECLEALGFL